MIPTSPTGSRTKRSTVTLSGTIYDVITLLTRTTQKHEYLQKEKRYSKKENANLPYFEKPFKWPAIIFYFIGTLKPYPLKPYFKGPVLAIILRAPLSCLFGFSWECSIYCFQVLFWRQPKESSECSTSQKWLPRDRSIQCLMGNTGSAASMQFFFSQKNLVHCTLFVIIVKQVHWRLTCTLLYLGC